MIARTSDPEARALEALAGLREQWCGRAWSRCYDAREEETVDGVAARITSELGWGTWPMRRLDATQAVEAVTAFLSRDLAYGTAILDPVEARRAADAWIAWLGDDAEYLTNGTWQGDRLSGWMPIEGSTFDTGVIGLGKRRAAILWVADED